MNRKIAAILAADVAGYSRLVAADEEGALRRLVEAQAVFKERVAAYRGRIFNTAGDAILAEFPSAVDATRAALDIQRDMSSRNDGLPADDRFLFRIGLNIGDVVEHEGDLLGDGVNVAARIQTLAPAGGLAISHWVREHTSGKINVPFRDIGKKALKNIPAPVHVFVADLAPVPSAAAAAANVAAPASSSMALKVAAAGVVLVALAAVAVTQFRGPQPSTPSIETVKPATPPTVEPAKAATPAIPATPPPTVITKPSEPAASSPPPAASTAAPSSTPATPPSVTTAPASPTPASIQPPPPSITPITPTAPAIEAVRPPSPPPAKTVVIPLPSAPSTAPAKAEREATIPERKRTCAEVLERAQLGDVTEQDRAFLRSQCR